MGIFGQKRDLIRNPVVAGQFYPGSADLLKTNVLKFYQNAKISSNTRPLRALLVPHAGYEFSGQTAAYAYRQLTDLQKYDNIFILASSHRVNLGKASVYSAGHYRTPLGEVKVNLNIAQKLTQNECIVFDPTAHSDEHSIEVQLPFLQVFGKIPPIIPIVIASHDRSICKDLANTLAPWFTPNNLFIVSADFSHYPSYEDAIRIDHQTANAFCSGEPSQFLDILQENEEEHVNGLSTSMCAWPAALSLMYLAEAETGLTYEQLHYSNSGDHKLYGDKKRVVGYHAIALRGKKPETGFYLSNRGKSEVLDLSRRTLEKYGSRPEKEDSPPHSSSEELLQSAGAFVSLKSNGKLRGCIGQFNARKPLEKLIPQLTIKSASHDSRFLPVQAKEIEDIDIEISILSPMVQIDNISDIALGRHGIYIKKGMQSGTFLPQVATENNWTLEKFLGHCAQDKVGIGYTGWKDAEIYIYEALVFKELR